MVLEIIHPGNWSQKPAWKKQETEAEFGSGGTGRFTPGCTYVTQDPSVSRYRNITATYSYITPKTLN